MAASPTPDWQLPLYDGTESGGLKTIANALSNALESALNLFKTKIGWGFLGPYTSLSALNAVPGTFIGQHATVSGSATASENGDYIWSGSAWVIRGSDSGWTNASLAANWSSYTTGGLGNVRYRRQANKLIIRGVALAGPSAGTTIFTLPAGFQPSSAFESFIVTGSSTLSPVAITISTAGVVALSSAPASGSVAVIGEMVLSLD